MLTAVFLVSNIHCPSCVSYARDVLHQVPGVQSFVEVSLIDQTIRVRYDDSVITSRAIADALVNAAFEVQHVTVVDDKNKQAESYDLDVSHGSTTNPWTLQWRRTKRKHIEHCNACQNERARKTKRSRTWAAMKGSKDTLPPVSPADRSASTGTTAADQPAVIDVDGSSGLADEAQNTATLSIGGMTCTSCSNAITESLKRLDFVVSVDVNSVVNSATVTYRGPKANADQIVESIEDLGYEATFDNVQQRPQTLPGRFKASLSIEGMTCGSCVGTITRGIQALPSVSSVNVDLVGASGTVEFSKRENLDMIRETIEDLGYEAALVSLDEPVVAPYKPAERTVQIQVDGIYCSHCPERIEEAFQKLRSSDPASSDFKISELPTLKRPIISVTYKPSPPSGLTLRKLISTISAADPNFNVSLYHPPSLEERSRRLQHRERWYILRRLAFTAIVAIPTLIIGIVFMMAVPASNSTRAWFDQPVWAGNVMRSEWALLIMTTPVMFYGADMFHKRAFKELWSMWKPKSRVPLLRRLYRFGSMNLLISLATIVAYFSSLAVLIMKANTKPMNNGSHRSSQTYFDTVTFLTFFILIGRFLEAYSKAKTGDAVSALSKLRPTDALLVEDGLKTIPVDQLEIGDIVQVPHGHSPPTDGVIEQDGTFLFDESSLTGESQPVKKVDNETVYTGTVNLSDPVRIKITDVGGTSMLDRIIGVVREGQAKRAPVERFADVLTGYFVPVITSLAITTWLIWLGFGLGGRLPEAWRDVQQGGWAFWSLEFAIAVFVVACPCGIGLAAPTALFVGGGLAAKHGILVQGGGEAFQEASRLNKIVFDKTGTLTQGQMKVTNFERVSRNFSDELILAMTNGMEEVSTHPIAKAIADHCQQSSMKFESIEVKEIPGLGMKGRFVVVRDEANSETFEVAIGNEKLLANLEQSSEKKKALPLDEKTPGATKSQGDNFYLTQLLQKYQSLGNSTAIFAIRKVDEANTRTSFHFEPAAIFAIADPVRPEAPHVLQSIRSRGVEVYMCTGDNQTTAHAIASQLNIPIANVRAGVLPQDKAAYINELQHNGSGQKSRQIVAFVGDGTNDTPALSAADVSIALSSGSDVAMTSSSFILLNSDLTTILTLITLAKRVFGRVMMNFAWAAVYNVCLVPVAAGVFFMVGATEDHGGFRLNPVWASVAMALSSVSVVGSSLALRLPEITFQGLQEKVLGWRKTR